MASLFHKRKGKIQSTTLIWKFFKKQKLRTGAKKMKKGPMRKKGPMIKKGIFESAQELINNE